MTLGPGLKYKKFKVERQDLSSGDTRVVITNLGYYDPMEEEVSEDDNSETVVIFRADELDP